MTTQELVILCKNQNQQAEKELFFRFAGKVLTLCRRYVSSKEEAKDFMQECFIHLFENIHKHDPERGNFEGWMYRVCTNKVLQILRKLKRETPIIYLDVLPDISEELEEKIDRIPREVLLDTIQQLPDGYRQILNLYIFEDYSHAEIAEEMNIAESTSRSQYARAKKLLKQLLQQKLNQSDLLYEKRLA